MFSGRFVHLIEEHGDQIITRVLGELRRHEGSTPASRFLECELQESGRDLLCNLGEWLSPEGRVELGKRYERWGQVIWDQAIPLHDTLRALFLIREKAEEYIEEHVLSKTNVELYAEEETERALTRFFDLLTVHLAEGYERRARLGAKAAHSFTG